MEINVILERVDSNGFRASCLDPVAEVAEGPTREVALQQLRVLVESRMKNVEFVRLQIGRQTLTNPIWPDDELTRDWLKGIAEARAAADARPDPWDESFQ